MDAGLMVICSLMIKSAGWRFTFISQKREYNRTVVHNDDAMMHQCLFYKIRTLNLIIKRDSKRENQQLCL